MYKDLISFLKFFGLFIFLNLFVSSFGTAQSIQPPILEVVTVNQADNKPILIWSYETPDSIDYYSIKRLIYEYENVNPMSFQTVDTVSNPYIYNYKDESVVFGEALPNERPEIYFIASHKIIGNLTIFDYSEIHQTMFLQAAYNYCEKQIKLIWNKYIGWNEAFNRYEIYCKTDNDPFILLGTNLMKTDTVFYHSSVNYATNYTYYIKALRSDGIESLSNVRSVTPQSPDLPTYLICDSIIVETNNKVQLYFNIDNDSEVDHYVLFKEDPVTHAYDSVNGTETVPDFFLKMSDPFFEYDLINKYFLAAVDSCGDIVLHSDTVNNIYLEVDEANDTRKKNALEWKDNNIITNYTITRCHDGICSIINETTDITYIDDIHELYMDQFTDQTGSGLFCYYVERHFNGNLSRSNYACVSRQEVYFLPTAFNPQSSIEENRIFKPKTAFISDYTLTIYGSFGDIIFETSNPDIGWDGTLQNGKLAPRASYLYFIRFRNAQGKLFQKKSYINLVY